MSEAKTETKTVAETVIRLTFRSDNMPERDLIGPCYVWAQSDNPKLKTKSGFVIRLRPGEVVFITEEGDYELHDAPKPPPKQQQPRAKPKEKAAPTPAITRKKAV